MTNLTPDRRAMLTAKYGLDRPRPMDPALNMTVQAILDGEQIVHKLYGDDLDVTVLFDPVLSPLLHAKADAIMRDVRAAVASGQAQYVMPGREAYDLEDSETREVFLSFGDIRICVCRNKVDYFVAMLEHYASRPWQCCVFNIVDDCHSSLKPEDGIDQTTKFLPLTRGQFVLLLDICRPCYAKAKQIVETNALLNQIDAYEQRLR